MNLSTLEIPVDEAEAYLREYAKLIESERTAEDEAIAQGYRAAKRGLRVISMTATIAAGGWFDNGLPRIAVVRADATKCYVHRGWSDNPGLVFTDSPAADNRGALVGSHSVRVPLTDMPELSRREWRRALTIVPVIPPRFRPKRSRLHRHHVLWEVESWTPEPPKDPALLRHIRGDLWSVLAVWDLTDLERAVLGQRA